VSTWSLNGGMSLYKSQLLKFERFYMIHGERQQRKDLNYKLLSGMIPESQNFDFYRHSHRELLKTANTVIGMRDILDDAELQYRKLLTFSPEVFVAHVNNAEEYQQKSTGLVP
jgi:hypothetical protein